MTAIGDVLRGFEILSCEEIRLGVVQCQLRSPSDMAVIFIGSWFVDDRGSWIVDRGSWIVDLGSLIADHRLRIMDYGLRITDYGSQITTDHGSRITDHRPWSQLGCITVSRSVAITGYQGPDTLRSVLINTAGVR